MPADRASSRPPPRAALRLIEWSLTKVEEGDDDDLLRAVNPAPWIDLESLRDARAALPPAVFARFSLCVPFVSSGAAFPPGAWGACQGGPEWTPGERIWIGVDLGGSLSDSAAVWVNERGSVGCEVFSGDAAVLDVQHLIYELASTYTVVELVLYPWRAAALGAEAEARGLVVTEYPQTDVRMVPGSKALYGAVVERRLTHDGHSVLAQHVSNGIQRSSRRGWRFDKPSDAVKIDALIALVMA